jgi:hypothetical protein
MELGGTTAGLAHVFVLEGGNVDGNARVDLGDATLNGRFETRIGAASTVPRNAIFINNSQIRYPNDGTTPPPLGPVSRIFYFNTGGATSLSRVVLTNSFVDVTTSGTFPIAFSDVTLGATAPIIQVANVGFATPAAPAFPGAKLDDIDAGPPPSLLGGSVSDPTGGVIDGDPLATY